MSGASTDGNGRAVDPRAAIQRAARVELPRRFYAAAAVEERDGGFALMLDGRLAKTPAKRPLVLPNRPVADAVLAEWEGQGERINPASMPVTRIANAAIDRVGGEMEAVAAEIVKYAGSDLLCYRAAEPRSLVERQEAIWSPLLAWAEDALGVRLVPATGIVAGAQDPSALRAVARLVQAYDAFKLAALHTATTLTGSAIIGLALARGRASAETAWQAAHVDEDWQMSQWGVDEVAIARRDLRWREMRAAALILTT